MERQLRHEVQLLARERAGVVDLSKKALEQLKIRVLDTVGVAIGALGAEPVVAMRRLTAELGGCPLATLIGGGKTNSIPIQFPPGG